MGESEIDHHVSPDDDGDLPSRLSSLGRSSATGPRHNANPATANLEQQRPDPAIGPAQHRNGVRGAERLRALDDERLDGVEGDAWTLRQVAFHLDNTFYADAVGEPADEDNAWSDYGGIWHVVRVRGAAHTLVNWTLGLLIGGWGGGSLVCTLWYALLEPDPGDPPKLLAFPLAAIGLGIGAVCAVLAVALPAAWLAPRVLRRRAAADPRPHTIVEGRVLRVRPVTTTGAGRAYWSITIDDGRHRRTRAIHAADRLASHIREGDIIRAQLGTRRQVIDIDVVQPGRW